MRALAPVTRSSGGLQLDWPMLSSTLSTQLPSAWLPAGGGPLPGPIASTKTTQES
jgi:hypothetical protein